MPQFARALVSVLLLSISYAALAQPGLKISQAWAPEVPPMSKVMAGYLVLENPAAGPWFLMGADAEGFGMVEIHQTRVEDGVARMFYQPFIEIPAGGKVEFAPGGYHLMLMQAKRRYRDGERIPVTLKFGNGDTLGIELAVKRR